MVAIAVMNYPMSLGTGQHGAIIKSIKRSLETGIANQKLDWVVLPGLVGIRSPRGGKWDTCRNHDKIGNPASIPFTTPWTANAN